MMCLVAEHHAFVGLSTSAKNARSIKGQRYQKRVVQSRSSSHLMRFVSSFLVSNVTAPVDKFTVTVNSPIRRGAMRKANMDLAAARVEARIDNDH